MNTRAIAARALAPTLGKKHTFSPGNLDLPQGLSSADRGFVLELCFSVLRWYPRLAAIAQSLLKKPLPPQEVEIWALLLIGLCQCDKLDTSEHAAINETVEAAMVLRKKWAKGLLNATLRRFLRERESLLTALEAKNSAVTTAHPAWLLARLQKNWPGAWEKIVLANNQHAPMVLRINKRQTTREAYKKQLAELDILSSEFPDCPEALMLDKPMDVRSLPGFDEGAVSVQDAAAQLAAVLLNVEPGQKVLDVCAAPGGKSAHLLECQPDIALTAIEKSPVRMERLEATFKRLGLEGTLMLGDSLAIVPTLPAHFDRILIDAPCSGTGVIRRHPDIKVCRTPQDLQELCLAQANLLSVVWPALKPGGLCLYATCSVLPEENTRQIHKFLQATPDAEAINLNTLPWGTQTPLGRYILPGQSNMDGFYYALLTKK